MPSKSLWHSYSLHTWTCACIYGRATRLHNRNNWTIYIDTFQMLLNIFGGIQEITSHASWFIGNFWEAHKLAQNQIQGLGDDGEGLVNAKWQAKGYIWIWVESSWWVRYLNFECRFPWLRMRSYLWIWNLRIRFSQTSIILNFKSLISHQSVQAFAHRFITDCGCNIWFLEIATLNTLY